MIHLKIIENNKANLWVRFAHLFIDRLCVLFFFFLFGVFSSSMYKLFEIEFFIDLLSPLARMSRLEDILFTSLMYYIYLVCMEYFTKGRTIGKYITGTKVMSLDGNKPTFQDYLIRNIIRFVPFEPFSFFGNNGWHDSWSNTRVIKIKSYESERLSKDEINSLGTKEIA